MPDLTFDKTNRCYFPTKYHGEVSISKAKWDEICQEPERFYYRENAEMIATALVNPEHVRYSKNYQNQFVYYKKFEMIRLGGKEVKNFWIQFLNTSKGLSPLPLYERRHKSCVPEIDVFLQDGK